MIKQMKHLQLYENFLAESDWYSVYNWDQAGQKYKIIYGNMTFQSAGLKYPDKSVVKIKYDTMRWSELDKKYVPFEDEKIGQIIGAFVNEETGEFLYGIRFFHPEGATSLDKIEEETIIEVVDPIPDFVTNNPRFEK